MRLARSRFCSSKMANPSLVSTVFLRMSLANGSSKW